MTCHFEPPTGVRNLSTSKKTGFLGLRPRNDFYFFAAVFLLYGCAALFGWDIHAPGVLSGNFFHKISPLEARVALWMDPSLSAYVCKNCRGSRSADPVTYRVGESFAPMLIEAFQSSFDEFVMMETEPTPEIMKQYGIQRLVQIRIRDFQTRLTWKGRILLELKTESVVYDPDLKEITRFESSGSSESEKIFSKKGGPEVHLNATLENTAEAVILHLQDLIRTGKTA